MDLYVGNNMETLMVFELLGFGIHRCKRKGKVKNCVRWHAFDDLFMVTLKVYLYVFQDSV